MDVLKGFHQKIVVKNSKQHLVRFKNKLADNDIWLEAEDIKNDNSLRCFRLEKRHQPFFSSSGRVSFSHQNMTW